MDTMQESAIALQHKNIETARRFIKLVEQRDISAFLDLFADDGVQYNYFQHGMLPPEIRGKKALREFWEPIPGRFSEMSFPVEAVYPIADPLKVIVKYRGVTKLKEGGEYNNEYFALFVFDEEGKVKEYHEYSDPVVTAKAFGMVEKVLKG